MYMYIHRRGVPSGACPAARETEERSSVDFLRATTAREPPLRGPLLTRTCPACQVQFVRLASARRNDKPRVRLVTDEPRESPAEKN